MKDELRIAVLKWVVRHLETVCCWLHWIPWYGCQLALWSCRLDEKYQLGEWTDSDAVKLKGKGEK